jgi:hypothetical protein
MVTVCCKLLKTKVAEHIGYLMSGILEKSLMECLSATIVIIQLVFGPIIYF